MRYQILNILILLGLISKIYAAEIPAAGVVLNLENDDPVPSVQIYLSSGKFVGESDSKGKFDIVLESAKANLTFKKEGFDELTINLAEQPDAFALEILLKSNVKALATTEVIGEKRVLAKSRVEIETLESIQGLQFDLNEHLSKIPGVSAQKEFSKDISYNGSRTEDLSVAIGPIKIPHLRHVDVGFPGNTSVLNPKVFRDVQINSDNQGGSLDAGLAGRIEYTPKTGDAEYFEGSLRAGVIMREAVLSGPALGFDDFVMSFRYLDPFVLEKFGEKFFTQYQGDECGSDASCSGSTSNDKSGQDWELNSGDLYLHLNSTDSNQNATRSTFLYSWDTYDIEQKLGKGYSVGTNIDRVSVFKGEQYHTLFSFEGAGADGFNYHLGYINSEDHKVFYDTSLVRTNGEIDREDLLLSDQTFQSEQYLVGLSQVLETPFLGARHSIGAEYEYVAKTQRDQIHIKIPLVDGGDVSFRPESIDQIIRLQSHLKWRDGGGAQTMQLGAWSTSDLEVYSPQLNLTTARKNLLPLGIQFLGEAAYQSAPKHQINNIQDLEIRSEENLHGLLGLSWSNDGNAIAMRTYARQYLSPEVPRPDAYWMYTPLNQASSAQVFGANLVYEWTNSPSYGWISNISSTYGTYDNDIQWEANRILDMSNSLRIYPRNDSLLSLIFTHKASIGQPTYKYIIDALERDPFSDQVLGGTSSILPGKEIDTYRTDVRLHLDLSAQGETLYLKNLRFYTEVNNIFSGFNFEGAQYIGGENVRQRGWTATRRRDVAQDQKQLEPFWAPGMGLFVQLGFEGNFGG